MAEQSIFDLTWARQDQWGGEWHSLGGRFRVAQQLMGDLLQQTATQAVEDSALAELVAWITDSLAAWANETHPPQQSALATLMAELRDVTQRPIDSATYDALASWMRQANFDAWLLTRLQHTRQLFTHLVDTNFDHIQLRHLQSLFRAQGELALAFHGLFGNGDLGRLEPDPGLPLIHVNAALMAKCATDLRLAQQALQQRCRLAYPNQTQWISWEGHMLYLADQMAYVCLQPLQAAGLLPADTAVVTYFQQSTEIRLIPYYNLMLVGLPSWVQNLYDEPPTAFLVIPHELGHSLYRFAPVNRLGQPAVKVHEALAQALHAAGFSAESWQARWLEELFADAFGCLLAGPVSVLGIQEYLASGVPEHFLEVGHDHPTAAIRPLIQSEMLRMIAERGIRTYEHIPNRLDEHWQRFLANNGGSVFRNNDIKRVEFPLPGSDEYISGGELLAQVRPVLTIIFDLFAELFSGEQALQQWQPWSGDIAVGHGSLEDEIMALRNQFHSFYCGGGSLLRSPVPPAPPAAYRPSALHLKIADIATRIGPTGPTTVIPKQEWRQIFAIDGWTDEGGKGQHMR